MQMFSIKEAFLWGWEQFKARYWFFIGIILVLFAVSIGVSFISDSAGVLVGLIQLVGMLVQWWLYIGLIMILLATYNKQHPPFRLLFNAKGEMLWHYILGTILYGLIVLAGLILLIFPGIIWAIKYHYYSFLIVEKGMQPIAALKRSGVITNGYKWHLLGFFLALGVLNFVGALLVGIGLLVSIPVSLLASVFVYKWLEERGSTVVDVEAEEVHETQQKVDA